MPKMLGIGLVVKIAGDGRWGNTYVLA